MTNEKGPPASLGEALRAGPKFDSMSPQAEEEILSFWKENKIFEKSVALRQAQGKPFVFFEGPPTANGIPGVHHIEARSFKDIILRYQTMRGRYVPRRAGWDTHGLPVEVEVEKKLGLKSKKDIEAFGVAEFNKKCRESVWEYKELWERLTERMGFWIDTKNPYITYNNSYIESLWGIIKKFNEKKYLYEDYKVIPWCARCGTALSSHELAQGYGKVKEDSVFVKFPISNLLAGRADLQFPNESQKTKAYFLAWTTTPWTLPGNVALALNPKIDYVTIQLESKPEEWLILAEARLEVISEKYEIINRVKGESLEGIKYEPLYPAGIQEKNIYTTVSADFVGAQDGTGIVHIAPAFGEDDFQLSKTHDLPVLVTTGADGLMNLPDTEFDRQWFKKADPLITADLEKRELLYKKEAYEHDYPFCWRCKNPLLYFARKTWWVDVNAVREKLLKNNQDINWHPEHIKDGRFGEWLKEKKNWAFSRERYWGTPLPVWRCVSCEKIKVPGSLKELDELNPDETSIIFMRHGEARHNVEKIAALDPSDDEKDGLTEKGREDVFESTKNLKKAKIDVIISSPATRTRQTAQIVGETLGVNNIDTVAELYDIYVGGFVGEPLENYREAFDDVAQRFDTKPKGAESLSELQARVTKAIGEIKAKYSGKNILIVSHGDPIRVAMNALNGGDKESFEKVKELNPGEFKKFELHNWPYNDSGELDLHKPYIDEIKLKCECGSAMSRVTEVCDVWFDSGAMPFAVGYYPDFFPADYITEAVDQTRGWFYNLLAVSTLLGEGTPYKNVISVGHLLDKSGKKMSKSLGNIVEPIGLMDKYGADATRWYFFTINQPWDSKNFKEEDVRDVGRRFFMILWNSLVYWKTYAGKITGKLKKPELIINQWLLAKWNSVLADVTEKIDGYDIVSAARALELFVVEDLSRWYIRRVRDYMKHERSDAAKESAGVLRFILEDLSKALAPFAPFISESIYKNVSEEKISVHLEDFPQAEKISASDKKIIEDMERVREIVNKALEARQKAAIKIRQPLGKLKIKGGKTKMSEELLELIKGEVNIKRIEEVDDTKEDIELDTEISDELREEGVIREFIRQVQDFRKELKLTPQDKIKLYAKSSTEIEKVLKSFSDMIEREVNISELIIGDLGESKSKEISVGDAVIEIGVSYEHHVKIENGN